MTQDRAGTLRLRDLPGSVFRRAGVSFALFLVVVAGLLAWARYADRNCYGGGIRGCPNAVPHDRGPYVPVPDYVGQAAATAIGHKATGTSSATESSDEACAKPGATVVSQHPEAGTRYSVHFAVDLICSDVDKHRIYYDDGPSSGFSPTPRP